MATPYPQKNYFSSGAIFFDKNEFVAKLLIRTSQRCVPSSEGVHYIRLAPRWFSGNAGGVLIFQYFYGVHTII